jgi:Icc-related predicted phosphoesterase
MRIVCISDTHNANGQIAVPDGDLLIHSGDATINGTANEIRLFNDWFTSLPHRHKVFVAGNHDWLFERDNVGARQLLDDSIIYLEDSVTEIEGVRIYGSPWQPRFFDWAFNLERGSDLAKKWEKIPDDIDVLITHGPPNGILDAVTRAMGMGNTGCEALRERIEELAVLERLKFHVFGHIHCGYGMHEQFGIRFVNGSTCDEEYRPTQPPIVVDS